jgi:hypothetical protein
MAYFLMIVAFEFFNEYASLKVDRSLKCETPAGAACQPPENSSCKACDEEARFGRICLQTQEHTYFLEYESLYPSPTKARLTPRGKRAS